METKLLLLVLICSLPSLLYLVYFLFRKILDHFRRTMPDMVPETMVQAVLLLLAVFCFLTCLLLVVWSFLARIPYYHMERSLVIAFLFLLMGILCLQVLQFVRWQNRQERSIFRKHGSQTQLRQQKILHNHPLPSHKDLAAKDGKYEEQVRKIA